LFIKKKLNLIINNSGYYYESNNSNYYLPGGFQLSKEIYQDLSSYVSSLKNILELELFYLFIYLFI